MKKSFFYAAGLAASLALAIGFISCGQEMDYSSEIDTISSLSAPNVTAKAWPGVNILTWDVISSAKSYEVWKDGTRVASVAVSDNLSYSDTDIANGQKYTYTVVSVSSSDPARSVYYTNAKTSVTLTAIVPPAATDALSLAAYENGWNGTEEKTLDTTNEKIAARLLTEDNVTALLKNGTLSVQFPAKPYLTYTVEACDTAASDVANSTYAKVEEDDEGNEFTNYYDVTTKLLGSFTTNAFLSNSYYLVKDSIDLTQAGTWSLKITAKSLNPVYDAKELALSKTFAVAEIGDTKKTSGASAVYTSASNVRVSWTPAQKADGTVFTSTYYRLYRKALGVAEPYALVSANVTEAITSEGATSYYADDGTAKGTKYSYVIVLTDGTSFGTAVFAETNAAFNIGTPVITCTKAKTYGRTDVYVNVVDSSVPAAHSVSDFTYTLYRSTLAKASDTTYAFGSFEKLGELTQFQYADSAYTANYVDTLDIGVYFYYVEKKEKSTGVSVNSVPYAGVVTVSTGTDTPSVLTSTGSEVDLNPAYSTWSLNNNDAATIASSYASMKASYITIDEENVVFTTSSTVDPFSYYESLDVYRAKIDSGVRASAFTKRTVTSAKVSATGTGTNDDGAEIKTSETVGYTLTDSYDGGSYAYLFIGTDSNGDTYYSDIYYVINSTVSNTNN